MTTRFLVLMGVMLAATAAQAQTASPGGLVAHHGMVYQTRKAGLPTEGFFEIANAGPADVLTAVACPDADTTVLADANGQVIASLAVPAGKMVSLSPDGPHLLLQVTHFAVAYGSVLPCSLTFQNAGTVSIFLYAAKAP